MIRKCCIAAFCLGLLSAGCGTTPLVALPKHPPVDREELNRKVDALLAYVSGATESLPDGLFAPLQATDDSESEKAAEFLAAAQRMRDYFAELARHKAQGVLGEDNRGYLELRSSDLFATAADKNAVQKGMAAENDCRKVLYRAIARASEEKGLTLTRVERAFAARRLATSAPGALVQAPSSDDEYALFQESVIGKKLGPAVKPGDWFAIP